MKTPSIHVRAFLTWLAIFPLVLICFLTVIPLMSSLLPVIKVLVLTLIVVPLAVYVVLPNLLKGYMAIAARQSDSKK
jgi:antibiotic biosynthesis monooxygenase (ABM) superfamily enzyme